MRTSIELLVLAGFLAVFSAGMWIFVIAPQRQEALAIRSVRNSATIQGRSANEAEAEYRSIAKILRDQGLR